ncbi:MAG: hypothetical protein IJ466_05815 [Clostridia bacterium]|nr:hypothetical protein [Clostridia bacterium]
MSMKDLETKARELRELKRMREELDGEIDAIEDEIKAHMTATDADTLTAGEYKITWKLVSSSRIDTAALKKSMPELAALYTKTTQSRRFCVQ